MLVSLEKVAEFYLALRAVLPEEVPRVLVDLSDDDASNMQYAMDGTLPGQKVPRDLKINCCDFFEGPSRTIHKWFDVRLIHYIEALSGAVSGVNAVEGLLEELQEIVDLLCTPVDEELEEGDIRADFGPDGPSPAALVMCGSEIAVIANRASEGGELQESLRGMAAQVNEEAVRRLSDDDDGDDPEIV
jgi:hypothetical protein